MIRLLIVDDSALMRKLLSGIFEQEGDFDIRTARNGAEALELAKSFAPQVATLDINMPVMDGLTCLSRLMIEAPLPVVIVSSQTLGRRRNHAGSASPGRCRSGRRSQRARSP